MNNATPYPFQQDEWAYLTGHLRLTTAESPDRKHSISSLDLLEEGKAVSYLDALASVYLSPSRLVTASLFSKRYAFLLVSPGLYAMTMFNKGLDLSVGNCRVESGYRDEAWIPNLRLTEVRVTQPASGHRCEWRDGVIQGIFAGHLAKIWRAVSAAARIPLSILWENTAVYVYALYERRIAEEADGERRFRMQEDFEYLVRDAPAVLFGEEHNPLARYYLPTGSVASSVAGSDKPVRIRKTCCFYYKVGSDYCPACPKAQR